LQREISVLEVQREGQTGNDIRQSPIFADALTVILV